MAGRFRAAIDVFPAEPLDPRHPIRQAVDAVLATYRAGAAQEALWQIGHTVIDDLEALSRVIPPYRMEVAQPELIPDYTASAP